MSAALWREGPRAALSADGKRLRLMHGPIDLIVGAEGPEAAVRAARVRARDAFAPVLERLVDELLRLRAPSGPAPEGPVARRMALAVAPLAEVFVTPMAAVAGAVADHVLAALLAPGHGLARAEVNNGGDIALWLGAGVATVAVCDDPGTRRFGARARIAAEDGIGGVATSGWRGRSQSLGIADAVTVLARDGAGADAAATLIANAVDLPGHTGVRRAPARTLSPDSDLGDRLVTVDVGPLAPAEADAALAAGLARAEDYRRRGLIVAAYLSLAGRRVATGGTDA